MARKRNVAPAPPDIAPDQTFVSPPTDTHQATRGYYVHSGGEEVGPLSHAEVQQHIDSRGFTRESLVWFEGAEQWESLHSSGTFRFEHIPPPITDGPASPPIAASASADAPVTPPSRPLTRPTRSQRFAFTKEPSGLTVFLKTMLWISLAVGVISLFFDFAQLGLATSRSIATAAAESNDARQWIIGIVQFLTFIVTGITFLMWIYRANLNARGFGATDMKFTPGTSVGYYFFRSSRTRKAVIAALEYSWRYPGWQPSEYPQTYRLAAHEKIPTSPP